MDDIANDRPAALLYGDFGKRSVEFRNGLWSMFMDKGTRTTMPAWETAARVTVARFRLDAARAKDRSEFDTLAAELARVSPEFARLWSEYDVVEVTEGSKEIGHHGSRVDGEGTDAMRLAARIERQGEQGVRRLRLSVRFPLVVGASLELRILEVDPRAAVPARRQRHHPGAIRLAQRWPESRRELEVADVLDASDACEGRARRVERSRTDDHRRSGVGQRPGGLDSDPRVTTGDDGDGAVQIAVPDSLARGRPLAVPGMDGCLLGFHAPESNGTRAEGKRVSSSQVPR